MNWFQPKWCNLLLETLIIHEVLLFVDISLNNTFHIQINISSVIICIIKYNLKIPEWTTRRMLFEAEQYKLFGFQLSGIHDMHINIFIFHRAAIDCLMKTKGNTRMNKLKRLKWYRKKYFRWGLGTLSKNMHFYKHKT